VLTSSTVVPASAGFAANRGLAGNRGLATSAGLPRTLALARTRSFTRIAVLGRIRVFADVAGPRLADGRALLRPAPGRGCRASADGPQLRVPAAGSRASSISSTGMSSRTG